MNKLSKEMELFLENVESLPEQKQRFIFYLMKLGLGESLAKDEYMDFMVILDAILRKDESVDVDEILQ